MNIPEASLMRSHTTVNAPFPFHKDVSYTEENVEKASHLYESYVQFLYQA